jgi:DNA-binding transcriptional regulator YdaS (Cro superfamily)
MSDPQDALERAIRAAGSAAKLASLLGLHRSSVSDWRKSRVPAERVARVEQLTGVPRTELRPDLFAVEAA